VDGPVVRAVGLTSFCGRQYGLHVLDPDAPPHAVSGSLGSNGAGKPAAVRLLLDDIRRNGGSASAIGLVVPPAAASERRDLHA
jgi:ABC-type multidrug transport system ATPase subunit